ncbi:MAG: DUF1801 domain-containing protein [Saprospiraceae bacterium]|nr:DUF1801 domain-containing protein [Saprospiraceae bacterium]
MKQTFNNVDEYIQFFPVEVQRLLNQIRLTIRQAVPEAVEGISYGMPAYKLMGKPLVYFGAYRNHIGFYATPSGHSEFSEALSVYKQGKGSVQFPLDKPMPLELIGQIARFRAHQILS